MLLRKISWNFQKNADGSPHKKIFDLAAKETFDIPAARPAPSHSFFSSPFFPPSPPSPLLSFPRLPRQPCQRAPSQDMDVKMVHRLAVFFAVIHYHPITLL